MGGYEFIVNPVAGAGKSAKLFEAIRKELDRRSIRYDYSISAYPGHAVDLALDALKKKCGQIVAVGGDGTVKEVAGALCGHDAVMGILPFGTGNDLARALNLPRDPLPALEVILAGNVRRMDAGFVNGSFFANVAGIGFDVDVLANTEKFKKRLNGMLPYMLGLFQALARLKPLDMELETEEGMTRMQGLMVAVANGTHFGGGMNVAPEADLFDGYFDICAVERVSVPMFLRLLPSFVKGKHISKRPVRYFRAKKITVRVKGEATVELDGELSETTPAMFTMAPGAIQMLCPSPLV